ncbi:MAG TPA: hypothetical protein VFE46_12315 [Pirellulales bacterium]|jgi:Flp pilus assembly pilin Flp|nr:hypothetical protein [Pirellulales bacterium]
MTNCRHTIRRFFGGEHGRAVVHCAVLLELIAIVCLAVMASIHINPTSNAHGPANSWASGR